LHLVGRHLLLYYDERTDGRQIKHVVYNLERNKTCVKTKLVFVSNDSNYSLNFK